MKSIELLLCAIIVIGILFCVVCISNLLDFKKMNSFNNTLSTYLKQNVFEFLKNGGEDPCELNHRFEVPHFSQECNYIVAESET